jgi:hypothetical protein
MVRLGLILFFYKSKPNVHLTLGSDASYTTRVFFGMIPIWGLRVENLNERDAGKQYFSLGIVDATYIQEGSRTCSVRFPQYLHAIPMPVAIYHEEHHCLQPVAQTPPGTQV